MGPPIAVVSRSPAGRALRAGRGARLAQHFVVDLYRIPVLGCGLVDREANRHRPVCVVDGGVRLDVVFDALQEVVYLGYERVVCHVPRVWLDGWKRPVVERARVVLLGVDAVVLDVSL